MPRWLQILLHLTATGVGAYVSVKSGSPIPLVVSGATQTAIGGIAQLYNTDGTPQSVAFNKEK
jgi:hypothetical protein